MLNAIGTLLAQHCGMHYVTWHASCRSTQSQAMSNGMLLAHCGSQVAVCYDVAMNCVLRGAGLDKRVAVFLPPRFCHRNSRREGWGIKPPTRSAARVEFKHTTTCHNTVQTATSKPSHRAKPCHNHLPQPQHAMWHVHIQGVFATSTTRNVALWQRLWDKQT